LGLVGGKKVPGRGTGIHSLPTVMGRGKDPVCYQCIPAPIDAPN
jgi:hypothetical protein